MTIRSELDDAALLVDRQSNKRAKIINKNKLLDKDITYKGKKILHSITKNPSDDDQTEIFNRIFVQKNFYSIDDRETIAAVVCKAKLQGK